MTITYTNKSLQLALSFIEPSASTIQAKRLNGVWSITATYGAL